MNDYREIYALTPVYDNSEQENVKKIYGYIACQAYLINESIKEGTTNKAYEIVYLKDVKNLKVNEYENLVQQYPLFTEDGKCSNSNFVDEIFTIFDTAKEAGEEKSNKLFEQLAKDKLIQPSNYGFLKNLHDLKRAIENEKSNLQSRLIELSIIEKYLNGQSKRI